MTITLYCLLAGFISLCATSWIFPKVLKLAKMKDIVDNPDARKLQKLPVPVLGGLAVFFGLTVGFAFILCLGVSLDNLLPLFLAAIMMLFVGAIDDIVGLTPRARLGIECVAVMILVFGSGECVDTFHGMWGVSLLPSWLGLLITIFAGVGIINAFNMIDGVNGLSSGLCIFCSIILTVIFFKRCDIADAVLASSFAGALTPFFFHNVFGKKSKMFIGDAGTMVMGLLVTWYMIRVMSSKSSYDNAGMNHAAMILAVASVPVADTLRVMFGRIRRGRSPFSADKTHLHHLFISLGVSHSITAFTEILIDALVVLGWYLAYKLGAGLNVQMYVTIVVAAILVWGTYFFLGYQKKRDTELLSKLVRFNTYTHFGHKNWWLWLQNVLDSRGCSLMKDEDF